MSPYEVLGLTEDESDERTIKRAYAKLLKQHRPDQDPEGFTRIHHAYQWVLACCSDVVDASGPLAPPANAGPAPSAATEETAEQKTDASWERACAAVRAADDLPPGDAREDALVTAIAAHTEMLQRGGADWEQARSLIIPLVLDQPRRWNGTPDAAIVRVLAHEPTCLEARILYLFKQQRFQAANDLVAAWVEHLEHAEVHLFHEGPVLERIMRWCVFLDFPLASRIAALMAGRATGLAVSRCDLALAAGHAAKKLPAEMLPALAAIFSGVVRSKPQVARAVGDHVKSLGRKHPVSRMLATYAPSMLRGKARTGAAAESESGFEPILRLVLTIIMVAAYIACQGLPNPPPLFLFLIGAFVLMLLYHGIVHLVRNRRSDERGGGSR